MQAIAILSIPVLMYCAGSADLTDANLDGAYLGGADLTRAKIQDATLHKAELSKTKMSDGTIYAYGASG